MVRPGSRFVWLAVGIVVLASGYALLLFGDPDAEEISEASKAEQRRRLERVRYLREQLASEAGHGE